MRNEKKGKGVYVLHTVNGHPVSGFLRGVTGKEARNDKGWFEQVSDPKTSVMVTRSGYAAKKWEQFDPQTRS